MLKRIDIFKTYIAFFFTKRKLNTWIKESAVKASELNEIRRDLSWTIIRPRWILIPIIGVAIYFISCTNYLQIRKEIERDYPNPGNWMKLRITPTSSILILRLKTIFIEILTVKYVC